MPKKKFKYWIITDEDNRPMSWSGDQLCYCTTADWQDGHHPVRPYTMKGAKQAIKKSTEYRKVNGFTVVNHKLIPLSFNNK